MSDKALGTDEQLFDSNTEEVVEEHASDSDEGQETSEEEQEQALDLEDVQENKAPKEKANESAEAQLKAFQKKVSSGDIKSPEDLPKAQRWMADFLKFPASENDEPAVDVDTFKTSLVEEIEAKAEFKSLYSKVEENATREQLKEINEFYKEFPKTKGNIQTELKALKMAVKFAKVDMDGTQERRRAMRIPVGGSKSRKASIEEMDYSEARERHPLKDRVAYLNKLAS